MGEGVRAVDDGLDAAPPRLVADRLTGKIWPVRFVMWQKCSTFVAGVIAREQPIREHVERRRRHRERDLRQRDAVAADALLPGVEHPAVVLVGRDDFVAGLQIEQYVVVVEARKNSWSAGSRAKGKGEVS